MANCLSSRIKSMIMDGDDRMKHVSVEMVKNRKFPMCWKEQEEMLVLAKNLSKI